MKTCLYNFDPFKPHFYIVKLGFTGLYIIFLISAQNIDCGYSLDDVAVLTSIHNLCFVPKYEKYQNFLSENFHFLVVKFSIYLNRHIFIMYNKCTQLLTGTEWNCTFLKKTLFGTASNLTLLLQQTGLTGFCKQHRSRWDGSSWTVSSWSTLFDIQSFNFTYKLLSKR